MKTFRYLLTLITIAVTIPNALQACAVTIYNDSQDPVIITTNDDANCIFVLLPGDEKEFGDHHVKAKFTVLIKDSAGNYVQNVAVRQYACSAGKEIRLGAQDLTSRRINPDLFIFGNPGTVDLRKREVCH